MIKLGIVMDSIKSINIKKDTSFAILLEAQKRNYKIYYMEITDLFIYGNAAYGMATLLKVQNNDIQWYNFIQRVEIKLSDLDVIFMRKDPPLNEEFIYATYILEYAERQGSLVINKPQSLRDYNEKIHSMYFADLIPNTIITSNQDKIKNFWHKNGDIILKPLSGMGGQSIFYVKKEDLNFSVIVEYLTHHGKKHCIVQKYLPEIKYGDKRILLIDGEPINYCLARIPKKGEIRGNLAAGGIGEVRQLSKQDIYIANRVGQEIKNKGLFFVGLDIIGNKLTEINITSPTCMCEIEAATFINIRGIIMDKIETKIRSN